MPQQVNAKSQKLMPPKDVSAFLRNSASFEIAWSKCKNADGYIIYLDTIPAIVKKDLSDEEAYVYVIETNVIQRSFAELLPSEKAAVLKDRYEKIICQLQGRFVKGVAVSQQNDSRNCLQWIRQRNVPLSFDGSYSSKRSILEP